MAANSLARESTLKAKLDERKTQAREAGWVRPVLWLWLACRWDRNKAEEMRDGVRGQPSGSHALYLETISPAYLANIHWWKTMRICPTMMRRHGTSEAATETKLKTYCEGSEMAHFLSGKAVSKAATPALWCMYLQQTISCVQHFLKEVFQPAGQGFENVLIRENLTVM